MIYRTPVPNLRIPVYYFQIGSTPAPPPLSLLSQKMSHTRLPPPATIMPFILYVSFPLPAVVLLLCSPPCSLLLPSPRRPPLSPVGPPGVPPPSFLPPHISDTLPNPTHLPTLHPHPPPPPLPLPHILPLPPNPHLTSPPPRSGPSQPQPPSMSPPLSLSPLPHSAPLLIPAPAKTTARSPRYLVDLFFRPPNLPRTFRSLSTQATLIPLQITTNTPPPPPPSSSPSAPPHPQAPPHFLPPLLSPHTPALPLQIKQRQTTPTPPPIQKHNISLSPHPFFPPPFTHTTPAIHSHSPPPPTIQISCRFLPPDIHKTPPLTAPSCPPRSAPTPCSPCSRAPPNSQRLSPPTNYLYISAPPPFSRIPHRPWPLPPLFI